MSLCELAIKPNRLRNLNRSVRLEVCFYDVKKTYLLDYIFVALIICILNKFFISFIIDIYFRRRLVI